MKTWKIVALFVGVTLMIATVGYVYYVKFYKTRNQNALIFKTINEEVRITVEYARTPDQWAQGLAGREKIESRTGMLFIFPQETILAFWMKGVKFPLDIIFINKDKRIVDLVTMQPCLVESCPTYTSKAPAQYVVEVPSGFAQRSGFDITDQVILPEETLQ